MGVPSIFAGANLRSPLEEVLLAVDQNIHLH